MDEFKFPEDQEKIRRAVFPHLTATEYAQMVRRQRNEFSALPKVEQNKIREAADRIAEQAKALHEQAKEVAARREAFRDRSNKSE